jgi:hypothetical protein
MVILENMVAKMIEENDGNIWWNAENVLTLHSQKGNNITLEHNKMVS